MMRLKEASRPWLPSWRLCAIISRSAACMRRSSPLGADTARERPQPADELRLHPMAAARVSGAPELQEQLGGQTSSHGYDVPLRGSNGVVEGVGEVWLVGNHGDLLLPGPITSNRLPAVDGRPVPRITWTCLLPRNGTLALRRVDSPPSK
jgi:hypothetical protein